MRKILKMLAVCMVFVMLVGCSKSGESKKDNSNNQSQSDQNGTKENNTDSGNHKGEEGNDQGKLPEGDLSEDIILALDPGHGGTFGGASYDGRNEKDLTLIVANYVKEYLEENYEGVQIVLTRTEDVTLSNDVKEDLEIRAQIAKDANADALISLHFNASEEHNQNGSMVFISHRDNVTNVSKLLAESILTELEGLGLKNHGTKTRNSNDMVDEEGKPLDYYAINRHCANRDIPGIIVEHCFMDHSNDKGYIDSEDDLKALAIADAEGIAKFYGLIKK
ncbi:N-acetylmuramoyl-L-alanine amidase family protein [Lachnoclostridium phytofermentans]|uniref:N-acetylmuramoyl-L-alanine amidase family protein n=1 Tax=Lachnoclostridium phytofermentans TaxID=66219 RepID=UPI000495E90F|nr:N-acetylmuramoyl-L-alanine amidase [Lachnoclostridium phytofermentans]